MINGRYHGEGHLVTATGDSYSGWWSNGKRAGKGVCNYSNGDAYSGEWADDVRHGQGTCTYGPDNPARQYSGAWCLDVPSGQGKLMYDSGEQTPTPQWCPFAHKNTCTRTHMPVQVQSIKGSGCMGSDPARVGAPTATVQSMMVRSSDKSSYGRMLRHLCPRSTGLAQKT